MTQLFQNSMPADRARGCSWADWLESNSLIAKNGGTLYNGASSDFGLNLASASSQYAKYALTGTEFASDEISIRFRFIPNFAHDDGVDHYLWCSESSEYFAFKRSANTILVWLGGTAITTINEPGYGAYWRTGEVNELIVAGTSLATKAYLNGHLVMDNPTAWSPTVITELYVGIDSALTAGRYFDGQVLGLQVYRDIITEQEAIDFYGSTTYHYMDAKDLEGVRLTTDKEMLPLEFITRGPAGSWMWVDWGDGEREKIEHTGISNNITTQHDYMGLFGTKQICFSGQLEETTYFKCSDSDLDGDIGTFDSMTSLTTLSLGSTGISGDIGSLSVLTSLTALWLNNTGVTGDIGGLSTLTSLIYMYLYNTSISGDVGGLAPCTSLSKAWLLTTSVSGDIAGLAPLTALTDLRLSNTSVTGDVGDLSPLTLLTKLYLYSTVVSYATTALPAWDGCDLRIYDCAWTEAEVDNFLVDLESGVGTAGYVYLHGTNASPSSTSITAIADLRTAGWTVQTNTLFVNDQTPLAATTIKFRVPGGNALTIHWGDGNTDVVTCNGVLNTYVHNYGATGDYVISLEHDHDKVTELRFEAQSHIGGDVGDKMSEMVGLTSYLFGYNCSVGGDISDLSGLTSLNYMHLGGNPVSGDIGGLAPLTALTDLYLNSTGVSGDIGGLAPLTALTDLRLYYTSVSGDVSGLAPLTGLTKLYLDSTGVSGDVSGLAPLVLLSNLRLNSTDVGHAAGALAPWSGIDMRFYDCALIAAEVNLFIIDLDAAGGINGTLDISGTNAAPTVASAAALAALDPGKGWTITTT